jgi:hypothetical protein
VLTLADWTSPDLTRTHLADLLVSGELVLILGAGVSMSSGLPSWPSLVEACEAEVGITHTGPDRSSQDLMKAIDEVRTELGGDDDKSLNEMVRRNLYPASFLAAGTYPDELLEKRMLIAVGAMVMASSRGSVSDVFTFNFDDLLEWYLGLHGFTTQIVANFPAPLRGDRDVTLFHPHGFLPLCEDSAPSTDWLVLSHSQLVERLTGEASKWPTLIESRLLSKTFLAVGTSMNDLDLEVLVRKARRAVTDRPLGFVVGATFDRRQRDALLDSGIVPVAVGSHEQIPAFLLEVCRIASTERE